MRLKNLQWDALGISVSVLCALHCVALPLLFSGLAVAGGPLLHNRWLEGGLLLLSLIFGILAFYKGCFVQHQNKLPLLLFLFGFVLLLLNLLYDAYPFLLVTAAAVAIIAAHVINYRKCRRFCGEMRDDS